MTDYERTNRVIIGLAVIALGIATIVVPGFLINTPAHDLFFSTVPRTVVGLVQVVAGLMMLAPLALPDFRRGLSVFGVDAVCLMWASVALYPATVDKVGNVVSLASWALVAVCVHRMVLPEGLRRVQQDP